MGQGHGFGSERAGGGQHAGNGFGDSEHTFSEQLAVNSEQFVERASVVCAAEGSRQMLSYARIFDKHSPTTAVHY
ncbi:hypothetical protein GCM10022407_25600 [Hymenobacter antarcticus]|uniref:Uncharacterized protein n=1 Tax=Hymenobacter antarcticus TaxID=486270 RepID=A0ABP7QAJ1_9BACT